jgi:hypothetical protein
MRAASLFVVAFALVAARADARPARRSRPTAYFLAADPHVPLVVVRDGRVRQAVSDEARGRSCGSPRRWTTIGSKWHALDAWGQIVATRTVSAKDLYEVTGCAELELLPKRRDDARTVLVSVESRWRPSPSLEWSPDAPLRASFEALLAKLTPSRMEASEVPGQCASIREQVRYFEVPGSVVGSGRWAVGAWDGGYVVASLERRVWSASRVQKQLGKPHFFTCHRPLAVFDMNGEGRPEIVLRFSEGTSWGETVLELDASGRWNEVAASPGGSTA